MSTRERGRGRERGRERERERKRERDGGREEINAGGKHGRKTTTISTTHTDTTTKDNHKRRTGDKEWS